MDLEITDMVPDFDGSFLWIDDEVAEILNVIVLPWENYVTILIEGFHFQNSGLDTHFL